MFTFLGDVTLPVSLALMKYREWNPFVAQTHRPGPTQEAVLWKILSTHAATTFGTRHAFKTLRTYREFAREVPICTYEELRPLIEEQEATGRPHLTASRPIHYAQTSGTTGKPKHIPILPETLEGIRRYQRLFAIAQWQGVPGIYRGAVLVITGQTVEGHLPGGTPFGSMSGLLGDCLPEGIRRKSVLSGTSLPAADYRRRYLTMACRALATPALSVLATPNPSMILRLLEVIREEFATLLDVLAGRVDREAGMEALRSPVSSERLAVLRSFLGREARLDFGMLWPTLRAVVTWTGGNCAVLVPRLRSLLPDGARLIEMGYLSSECLGSLNVDVATNRCVLTLHENLFEFLELEDGAAGSRQPRVLSELETGRKYSVIVTTPQGLYRYAMHDIVEVTGRFNETPTIRFVQKGKGVTSITGEKLYEHQVIEAVEAALRSFAVRAEFYVMLADVERARYALCVEIAPGMPEIGPAVDARLAELNVEYRAKRDSGRLRPLEVHGVRPGTGEAYRRHCIERGQREAQFKMVKLQYAHECSFDFLGQRSP